MPARIKYRCESDSSFIYLDPDQENLPNLILENEMKINSFLGRTSIIYDQIVNMSQVVSSDIICNSSLHHVSFDTEYRVLISGGIVEQMDKDLFSDTHAPFSLDTIFKISSCKVDYEHSSDSLPLQNTKWLLASLNTEAGDTLYPTCEYNEVALTFTQEKLTDTTMMLLLDNGDGTCDYEYNLLKGDGVEFFRTVCVLMLPNITFDMSQFNNNMSSILFDPSWDKRTHGYTIDGNTMVLTNSDSEGSLHFYAENDH